MEKQCSKCLEIKSIDNFYKNPNGKEGHRDICKKCFNEKTKKYYIDNKNELCEYKKKWRENNIESILEKEKIRRENFTDEDKLIIKQYNKEWRENNIEYEKIKNQEYYINNKEKILLKTKEYRDNNKEKIKEYRDNHKDIRNSKRNEKLRSNIIFALEKSIRNLIYDIFKRNGFKKSSRTHEILGCSFIELKAYIESKFESWMTWENKGLYNGELNYGWDIDHIIPLSSAKNEEELIKLNHYTNLQPLCSYKNRYIKRNLYLNI